MNEKIIALRLDALTKASANNAMEGLYEREDDAAVLEAFARGEIDGAEFDRQVRENLRAALAARSVE